MFDNQRNRRLWRVLALDGRIEPLSTFGDTRDHVLGPVVGSVIVEQDGVGGFVKVSVHAPTTKPIDPMHLAMMPPNNVLQVQSHLLALMPLLQCVQSRLQHKPF